MAPIPESHRPMSFVIRVQEGKSGLRGQVVAVATGLTSLFDDLRDAMAFIEAQLRKEEAPPEGGGRE